MKRALLIFTLSVFGATAFAQGGDKMENKFDGLYRIFPGDSPVLSTESTDAPEAAVTILWSEDFSNGVPSGWQNVGNPPAALWEYRGVAGTTNPDTSMGSRGAYGSGVPIASPTRANGFMIFDSDYLDNGGTVGGVGAAPAPHSGALITDPIDLTGQPEVKLEFYHYHRSYSDGAYVLASTNGGATWDTLWSQVSGEGEWGPNDITDNPELVSLDVGSQIGGQSNVILNFLYASNNVGSSGPGLYFWMIDDIRLIVKPTNDLVMDAVAIFSDPRGLFYGQTPQSQVLPMTFGAAFTNLGQAQQDNVQLDVEVNMGAASVFTASDGGINVAPDSTREIIITTPTYTPSQVGGYTTLFTVTSDSIDEIPMNNTMDRVFYITDSIYGLDTRVISSFLGSNSFASATNNPGNFDGMIMANYYELTNSDTITGVELTLSSATVPGAGVVVAVRDTFTDVSPAYPVRFESDVYFITQADSAAGRVFIPFDPNLLPGGIEDLVLEANDFLVSAELFSSNGDFTVRIADDATVEQPFYSSMIYLPVQNGWYSNGNAFHIRMVLPEDVSRLWEGIEEHNAFNFSGVYPNPASTHAQFTYSLENASDVKFSIRDLSGKLVVEFNEGTQHAGDHMKYLDVSDYAAGVYFFELNVNGQKAVKKFVVNR